MIYKLMIKLKIKLFMLLHLKGLYLKIIDILSNEDTKEHDDISDEISEIRMNYALKLYHDINGFFPVDRCEHCEKIPFNVVNKIISAYLLIKFDICDLYEGIDSFISIYSSDKKERFIKEFSDEEFQDFNKNLDLTMDKINKEIKSINLCKESNVKLNRFNVGMSIIINELNCKRYLSYQQFNYLLSESNFTKEELDDLPDCDKFKELIFRSLFEKLN